jgi:hypothetical protein
MVDHNKLGFVKFEYFPVPISPARFQLWGGPPFGAKQRGPDFNKEEAAFHEGVRRLGWGMDISAATRQKAILNFLIDHR